MTINRQVLGVLILLILTVSPVLAAAEHADPATTQTGMVEYQLVLLHRGPDQQPLGERQIQALQEQHLAFLGALYDQGRVVIVGPVDGGETLRGLVVLDVGSVAAAEELMSRDAWIRAGRMRAEIHPWLTRAGVTRKAPEFLHLAKVTVVLLLRPAGAPEYPEAELQVIERAHQAHLQALRDSGELVWAGSIEDGGELRGVLVLRHGDLERFAQRLSGDPAVQAGLLGMRLHPWHVPKGSLPEAAAAPADPERDDADRVRVDPDSDAAAIALALATVERMGGWEAWQRTRFLSWKFFGGRQHYWDRHTGDIRITGKLERPPGETHDYLWLMNVVRQTGRVWVDGEQVADQQRLTELLDLGRRLWVNDSYWLIMPFKLLDPGVTLKHAGERRTEAGRPADVLQLTFGEGVGYTPENRYEIFVDKESGLVEQWSFFANAADETPRFTLPWSGWQRFGSIMIATRRGRDQDWAVAVHDELPRSVFHDPAPVDLGPR